MFKVGDLVRIRPEWVREYEKIPVGIVTAVGDRDGVDVYWFDEGTVLHSEDPRLLWLLNKS